MSITLSVSAVERSTYVVTVTFYDENGDLVTPTEITWTLTDSDGRVINNRQNVAVAPLASVIHIVLYGDDLALSTGGSETRVLTVEGAYNSTVGTGLPLKGQARFVVENLTAVS